MDLIVVFLFACVFKDSLGDFYVNVTQTGCISFDFVINLETDTINIEKDSTSVLQGIFTGADDIVLTTGNFTDRITNYKINRRYGTLSFCLLNTTIYDGGVYAFKKSSTQKFTKTLYVLDMPTKPSISVIHNGTIDLIDGILACLSVSKSSPTGLPFNYTWYENGTYIKRDDKYKCNENNKCSELIIIVERNDEFNRYSCSATEQYGQTSDLSDIEVIDPKRKPNVTLNPSDEIYRILINHSLKIECRVVDAHPEVDLFIWRKNTTFISGQSDKFLTIFNVSKTDATDYECIASNGLYNGTAHISLDVLYGPEISPMTTFFQEDGFQIIKSCNVKSNPHATDENVTWTKQDNDTFVEKGHQLNISAVNRKDMGTFICTVRIKLKPTNEVAVERSANETLLIDVLYGPDITLIPTYAQMQGSSLFLTCNVTSNPAASNETVIWTKHGNDTFRQNSLQLSIPSLNKLDMGMFNCSARIRLRPSNGTPVLRTDSKDVQIDVLYGPEISPLTEYSQEAGFQIIKSCDVKSNPQAADENVTWTKQDNSSFFQKGVFLNISSANRNDQGTYICTVRINFDPTGGPHIERAANETVDIQILFGPTIDLMKTYSREEGKNLTIPCIVFSNPPATSDNIIWTKEGNTTFQQEGQQLYIASVTKIDNGTYVCNVSILLKPTDRDSVVRSKSELVILNVLYQPIVSVLGGNDIYEGNTTTAICLVNSNPLSNISWTYLPNNNNIPESNNTFHPYHNISSELKFESAKCENTGRYRCQANNNVISPTSKTVEIHVKCKPRLSSIEGTFENITIGRNESLNHTIEYHGFPQPACDLKFNNTAVLGFNVDVIPYNLPYKSGCRITKTVITEADIGPYEMKLNNSVGQSVITFNIIFQREPDAPLLHDVDCIAKPEAVVIKWQSRWDGGLAQSFFVQYKPIEDSNFITWERLIDDGVGKIYSNIIYMLIPGKNYIFRVSASNDKGSAPSETVNCTVVGKDNNETDSLTVIGITTGSVLGIICVAVVFGVLFFMRRRSKQLESHKNSSQLIKSSKKTLEDEEEEDGLKANPMYVTSGQIESDTNNGPVYSVVQKSNRMQQSESENDGNSNTVYSNVCKKGKKETTNQSIEMGCVYENANDIKYDKSNTHVNTNADRKVHINRGHVPIKNKDGLVYADLDLAPEPNGKRFVIRGLENRNNYAVIDLAKTAEPLPSDTDDEEDDTQNKKSH